MTLAGGNQYIEENGENGGCLIVHENSECESQRFPLAAYKEILISRKLRIRF